MKLKVIIARPGEKAVIEEIAPGYDSLEQIVGGELEFSTPIMNDVVVACDRQGKEKGKMPNRFYFGDMSIPFIRDGQEVDVFAGTIVIIGHRKGKGDAGLAYRVRNRPVHGYLWGAAVCDGLEIGGC